MADEISFRHISTGKTVYFTIRNTSRQMWNGGDWEALTVANWGNYDIALAEDTPASGYLYCGDWPVDAQMTAGWYIVDIYEAAVPATPAISDPFLESRTGYWDGTTFKSWGADLQQIKGQAVTCAAGVTVLASVGTAATSTAQTGDSYARLGAPVGASVSADVLDVKNRLVTAAAIVAAFEALDSTFYVTANP